VGEALRAVLLDRRSGDLAPLTEALLFSAARLEMVRREVQPALDRGAIVVAERCYLSTLVYQGVAAEPPGDPVLLRRLTEAVLGACFPDVILLLHVDADTSRRRRAGREVDRIEARDGTFVERVCAGFRRLGATEPRVVLIDATRPESDVFASVRDAARAALEAVE
jgi:dTMP kinase